MKYFLLSITFFLNTALNAQWIQTNLGDTQYGNNLYATDTEVFAATLNGVYSTTDVGDPWFTIGLQNRLVFDVITSGQYILAATENIGPGVYRTSDHGSNWIETNGMINQSVRAFTKNSSYIFACTWGGGVFRSSDDGANWQLLGLTNVGFRSIYAVGETIFAGGENVYFSTNNGDNWDSRQLPYPAGDTWCFYYNNGKVYAGDMGLYSSTDLGNSWQLEYGVTFDSLGYPIDVKMFRDIISYNNTLIASVAFNSIYISYDSGQSWSSFNEGLIADWTFSALAIKTPFVWALTGGFGNAYRRHVSEIVTDVGGKGKIINDFKLEQNYPNPFNPSTKIQYTVSSAQFISLKVYDVLGKEVAALVNEEKPAGSYELNWYAKDLPSGVYFYRIKAGEFVETKKMILLR